MRKIKLFCCLAFIACSSFAQNLPMCDFFPKIIESSKIKFKDIKGNKISVDTTGYYRETFETYDLKSTNSYSSSIGIIGIDRSLLYDNDYDQIWEADLGKFMDRDSAYARLNSVMEEIKSCNKNFDFVEHKITRSYFPVYTLVEYTSYGYNAYHIYFEMALNETDGYRPVLRIYNDAAPIAFHMTLQESTDSPFTKQLFSLFNESETNFDNIKGDKTKESPYGIFKSTTCLTGTDYCEINEGMFNDKFIAHVNGHISEAQADAFIDTLKMGFIFCLGKNYAWSVDAKTGDILFSELKNALTNHKASLALRKDKAKENDYSISIVFFGRNKIYKEEGSRN